MPSLLLCGHKLTGSQLNKQVKVHTGSGENFRVHCDTFRLLGLGLLFFDVQGCLQEFDWGQVFQSLIIKES